MSNFRAWQVDLFLLEHWQEDSSLSVDAHREEIFAKYVALGVRGREPYRNQQRRLEDRSARDLPQYSQELLDRIRLPAERDLNDDPCWLRTCYDPSSEDLWAQIQDYIDTKIVGPGIESESIDPQRDEENGYDPKEDENPWICFYSEYLFRLAAGRIHIVDEKTLASEGPDAGTVLVMWYDECGRAIRYYREKAMHAVEIANLETCYLKDYACWNNAEIGECYEWGEPLGPPYSENRGETSK
ncbi:uncharacterized protein N7498_010783 [Penicillium cinerascens]|uniref:Uncharacterized protein n=1 Tax=Penicillium cinerascens TaxID=70096 RepID=A0A9W9M7K1_9EURO|nr:uncharacterized protein N7498_010783 [Penicillium cinerascens]KAJ5191798.1 hypothetical protein N7498_010783 [Penicillium cinerascens]